MSGDFGEGYTYDYPHRVVYAAGKTKESVVEKILQSTGILELSKFQSFYSQMDFFDKYERFYKSEESDLMYEKYNQINEFLNQSFSEIMMYRFSFWTSENIYIIGETKNGDRTGIYIKSEFVYNP
ncbi:MAG: nuclease A inhibitor family protein [Cyanobacteria bacterium J06621_15]